jgi:hypothetical protein
MLSINTANAMPLVPLKFGVTKCPASTLHIFQRKLLPPDVFHMPLGWLMPAIVYNAFSCHTFSIMLVGTLLTPPLEKGQLPTTRQCLTFAAS